MSVERLSRTIAYVACFYAFSLFATAMGMAAVNVAGLAYTSSTCTTGPCYTVTGRAIAPGPGIAQTVIKPVKASPKNSVELAEAPEAQKL